ncbi:hypothetical protein G7046_g3900 [Stylonectria norvegica]|nr:hypothetical protein G7046_g3900 [Stylonectria norvegica]
MDASSSPSSWMANSAAPTAPYTNRVPSPPLIHVSPRSRLPGQGLPVLTPSYENIDSSQLRGHDVQIITQNGAETATNRVTNWTYEQRRTAQPILDFLYLGPSSAARDHTFLAREGITMILIVRDARMAPRPLLTVDKAAAALEIVVHYVDIEGPHELIPKFSKTIHIINDHLLRVRHGQTPGDNTVVQIPNVAAHLYRAKVLIVCETGNDRSAAIAAAYIMAVFGKDMVTALEYISLHRFCCCFDEDTKRKLQSWGDILRARAQVATFSQGSSSTLHPASSGPGFDTRPSVGTKRRLEDMMVDDVDDAPSSGSSLDRDRFAGREFLSPFMDCGDLEGYAGVRRGSEFLYVYIPRLPWRHLGVCSLDICKRLQQGSLCWMQDSKKRKSVSTESSPAHNLTSPPTVLVLLRPTLYNRHSPFIPCHRQRQRRACRRAQHYPPLIEHNITTRAMNSQGPPREAAASQSSNARDSPRENEPSNAAATGQSNSDGMLQLVEPDYSNDSDSDDGYRLAANQPRPRNLTERRRLDAAVFEAWIADNQTEAEAARGTANPSTTADAGYMSVARLVQGNEDRKIIASPREYQIELFERLGKTLIAALLLRHTLDEELEDRARGKRKKIAFFLVDKVALCFQQHAVLSCNLDHSIAKFYGDVTGMMKTKAFWDAQLDQHMVVVCTAQILLDCLRNGFTKMSQINLIIFDEAHHAKKNHPYARIIKDHYVREHGDRPRILGMTASPVDAQTNDVRAAASELESMLCSEIATVSDNVLANSQARKHQIEIKETYERLECPEDSRTQLCETIANQVYTNPLFRAHLEFATEASSSLGPWCADRYWQLLITQSETARLAARTDRDSTEDFWSSRREQAIAAVQRVQKIVEAHQFESVSKSPAILSSKTFTLHNILSNAFSLGTKRCIVFVEKRYTACILADLFAQPDMKIPGMTVAYMASAAAGTLNDRLLLMVNRFKRGETNCLFATPVAEEGIDIPDCDLIVRFDIYTSVIQYLQSKGRARQANSRYVTMVENGNLRHLRSLHQASRDAMALRQFCSALPSDRKLQDHANDPIAVAQCEESGQKSYEVASTGARLTFAHSVEVLASFASSLSTSLDPSPRAEYMVTSFGSKFVANVILPESSPLKTVSGFPQRNKILARCSAAFEACVQLIKKKYIDDHFQPVFTKKLPAMRNARLAVSSNKKADYNMRLKPQFWSTTSDKASGELYLIAMALEKPEAAGYGNRPLLLLSRQEFPDLPPIQLFFGNGKTSSAVLISSHDSVKLTENQVGRLATFTMTIFADVFSKEYDANVREIPYFLAPCAQSHCEVLQRAAAQIDWPIVDLVHENGNLSWENASKLFFYDKFVIDPWDGSRKFITHGIDQALRPSDPTPEGVPEPRRRSYRLGAQNIKEYSNSLWAKARNRTVLREDQPVVRAELLSLRRNLLDEFQIDEDRNNTCYIILEFLRVSPVSFLYHVRCELKIETDQHELPTYVVEMAMAFPAIIHRIDSVLLALEACSLVALDIKPSLALEALTKDSENTDERGEQVGFQAGMGNNYERLEFLGDSFLKMATTISLFTLIPDSNEFEYHVERMLLVCNQNLFNHAVHGSRRLQEYIRSKAFDRRAWYPAMRLTKGKAPKSELRHNLADKSIADVCEALIGAAYLTSIAGNFDMAVKAVTKMVKSKNHKMESFADYYAAFRVPEWQSGPSSAAQRCLVEQVAEATGHLYRFRSAPLLRSVFKHPSYPYESIPNYQRLEFLGDALLDMAVVNYLFKRFPSADPQWLTEHKMAMASNQFLGCVCVKLKLHKHLLLTTSSLIGQISEYVNEFEKAEEDARQEASANGVEMQHDFWLNVAQPPKALPDIVEALIGAMFVDSQYNYGIVDEFFKRFILPFFENMALYDTFASKHPVTFLAHKMQHELSCTEWRICTSSVPCEEGIQALTESDVICALLVHGKVCAYGKAKSGRSAKIIMAEKALQRFKGPGETVKLEMGYRAAAIAFDSTPAPQAIVAIANIAAVAFNDDKAPGPLNLI